MKLDKVVCPSCQNNNFRGVAKGDSFGIYCRACGAFVKWGNKKERLSLLTEDPEDLTKELETILIGLERIEKKLDSILSYSRKGGDSFG